MDDSVILTMIYAIVSKHCCTIVAMDLEKRVLEIDGVDMIGCAQELEETLGDYLV